MKSCNWFLGVVMAFALSSVASAADDARLVGTWRPTAVTTVTLKTNAVTKLFGDNPIGLLQYTRGGHVVVFLSTGTPHQPQGNVLTDEDRAAIHKGIIGAYAGKYRIEGSKVIHQVTAAWWPHFIGSEQTRFFEVSGSTLTLKTAPFVSPRTGDEIVSTLTWERVE
jgi:hypothetical protein